MHEIHRGVRLTQKIIIIIHDLLHTFIFAARLDETEKCLSTVLSEKNELKAALGVQLSFELEESRSADSQTAKDWINEKKSFERRVGESEQVLLALAKENEELQTKIHAVEKENAALKAAKGSVPTQDEMQEKLMTEMGTLKMTFCKEKKKMAARQQELEGLLIEALKDKFDGEDNEIVKKLKETQMEILGSKNVVAE
jgi:hypothetical protein